MYKIKYIFFKNLLHFCETVIFNVDTTTVITGSNGSGKTCLLNIINDIFIMEDKNTIFKIYTQNKSSNAESFFGVCYEIDDNHINELKTFSVCKYIADQADKSFSNMTIHKIENREENIKKIARCIINFPIKKYIVDMRVFNNYTQNSDRYIVPITKNDCSLKKSMEIFIKKIGNSPSKYFATNKSYFKNNINFDSNLFSKVKVDDKSFPNFEKNNKNCGDHNYISIKNLAVTEFEDLFKYVDKFSKIETVYLSQERGLYNSITCSTDSTNSKRYCIEDMQKDLMYIQKFCSSYFHICDYVEKNYGLDIFLQSSKDDIYTKINFREKRGLCRELFFHQVPGSLTNALFMIVPIIRSMIDNNKFVFLCDEIEQNMDNHNMKNLFDKLSELFSQYHNKNMVIVTHNKKFMESIVNKANIKYIDRYKNLCGKVTDINNSLANIESQNKAAKLSELLDLLLSRDKKKICVEGITDMIFVEYFLEKKCDVSCGLFNFKGFGNMEKLMNDIKNTNNNILYLYDNDFDDSNKKNLTSFCNSIGFKIDLECYIVEKIFEEKTSSALMFGEKNFDCFIKKYKENSEKREYNGIPILFKKYVKYTIRDLLYKLYFGKKCASLEPMFDNMKKTTEAQINNENIHEEDICVKLYNFIKKN